MGFSPLKWKVPELGSKGEAHQEVEDGGDEDGPVAAEVGVGDEGPQEGDHRGGSQPGVDVGRRRGGGLSERPRQVGDEIGHDAVVGESLRHLYPCMAPWKKRASGARRE